MLDTNIIENYGLLLKKGLKGGGGMHSGGEYTVHGGQSKESVWSHR